jgi:lipoate-protein ligase B
MKRFLLIAGDNYYPEAYTGNWIGCFSTYEEAATKVILVEHKRIITHGKRKGQEEITGKSHQIDGRDYDWWDIVDLREWTEK